jgi:hypothetical protein
MRNAMKELRSLPEMLPAVEGNINTTTVLIWIILINDAIQKLILTFLYTWGWPRKRVKTCSIATNH